MNANQFETYLALQQQIIKSLSRIALALEQMIPTGQAPNYQLALSDYATFDWASIGAVVVQKDVEGPTAIAWKNFTYLRRSPTNSFGAAIWFSRCTGKDEQGANKYERLCTFKALSVPEPLPQKVTSHQRLGR